MPTAFALILTPVALAIVPKLKFDFEVIMYIAIFVSLHVFAAVIARRTSSPERFEDFAKNVLELSSMRQIDQKSINILYNPIGQLTDRKSR